jgi:glycosyltransferase involved in cell wall biosynthesis
MLSVIIPTKDCERILVHTLAMLVSASVSGLVADVVIADAGSRDDTGEIADIAGCTLLVSAEPLGVRLHAAAAAARGNWLLFLHPGAVIETAWAETVMRFIEETDWLDVADARAAVFRRAQSAGEQAFLPALAALVRSALGERPLPQQGLLISRGHYDALGGHRDDKPDPEAGLIKRIGRRNLVRLDRTITLLGDKPRKRRADSNT